MSNYDTLDLRQLAETWVDMLCEEGECDEEMGKELGKLCVQLGCEATPEGLQEQGDMHEPLLIHEDYFVQHAKDLAEECYAFCRDADWPMNHIDWEAAAKALQQDYTPVEYDGQTFYVRL